MNRHTMEKLLNATFECDHSDQKMTHYSNLTWEQTCEECGEIIKSGTYEKSEYGHILTPTPQDEPVGVMVSMDVSKGDDPEFRIFGRIYEVMRDGEGEGEVTYLAIEESRNFETPQQRKPLTDEQQKDAARWAYIRKHWKTVNFRFNKHPNTISGFTITVSDKINNSNSKPLDQEIDAAIEAAHGIKE